MSFRSSKAHIVRISGAKKLPKTLRRGSGWALGSLLGDYFGGIFNISILIIMFVGVILKLLKRIIR